MATLRSLHGSGPEQQEYNDVRNPFKNIRLSKIPWVRKLHGATRDPLSHVPLLSSNKYKSPVCPATGRVFCAECQEARRSRRPTFNSRLSLLFKPMWCSGCERRHVAADFSPSQRTQPDASRVCVGRQGYRTVCSHLKIRFDTLTLNMPIDDGEWRADRSVIVCCGDEVHNLGSVGILSCPLEVIDFSVTETRCGPGPDEEKKNHVALIEWVATLPPKPLDDVESLEKEAADLIEGLFAASPRSFGPLWTTSPEGLREMESYVNKGYDGDTVCLSIGSIAPSGSHIEVWPETYNSIPPGSGSGSGESAEVCQIPSHIRFSCTFDFDCKDACSPGWITQLDPDSYDHFADPATKNITWCDDRSCATSFELIQNKALRELSHKTNVEYSSSSLQRATLRRMFEEKAQLLRRWSGGWDRRDRYQYRDPRGRGNRVITSA
ncbi:hypothetical protein GMORB2_5288 [Geosmithia morbida]|uniref:Uncharacterized protein n=1 Tax=Geosmithia morbida TaxID=1094350 RepID=A0A9P5D374_9HYPO|nr:uncharacterized protein GMORB2_5288 [Geosmithia morbida]KAF4124622.1 hypothetical protein GMORB2_5288 [Geosmithia morbida]